MAIGERNTFIVAIAIAAAVVTLIPTAAHAQSPLHILEGLASIFCCEFMKDGTWASPSGMFAAHPTLPMGSIVRVSRGSRTVTLQVRDRGPARHLHRAIDLSHAAAWALRIDGLGFVRIAVLRRGYVQ